MYAVVLIEKSDAKAADRLAWQALQNDLAGCTTRLDAAKRLGESAFVLTLPDDTEAFVNVLSLACTQGFAHRVLYCAELPACYSWEPNNHD